MVLRSDEEANESRVVRDENLRSSITSGAKAIAGVGAVAVASPLVSKILPFLSSYIPAELAMKGINKVSPKLGEFLKQGQEKGLDLQEGLNFIKDKLGSVKKESEEKSTESRNVIQKYSANLHQYISGLIQKGSAPIEAASKAKKFLDKPQQDIIKKIENDYKTDFGSIVESIFGKGDIAQKPNSTESMESKMSKFSLLDQSQQVQQQQPQQNQAQSGGLDPQVAQILQQGQALLQRFKR